MQDRIAKILVFADMHGMVGSAQKYPELFAAKYDAYFILGDTEWFVLKEILANIDSSKPIYGILGNHDRWDLYDDYPVENIHGKRVDVNGITFAGFQGSERYSAADKPMYTQSESRNIGLMIPKADVLISHTSPYLGEENPSHTGLIGVDYYIWENHPKYVLHGHHHSDSQCVISGTHVISLYRVHALEIDI